MGLFIISFLSFLPSSFLSLFLSLFPSFFLSFFLSCLFRATPTAYGSFQARGWISYSCRSTSQPQQCQIRATCATYTTAHGNTRSLTHWSRPGIEPTSSWILGRFVTTEPQQELPSPSMSFKLALAVTSLTVDPSIPFPSGMIPWVVLSQPRGALTAPLAP